MKHTEIDKNKWDRCIDNSLNCLIYVQSFYLDKISPGWNALVLNDYEAVMPMTWRKKYFISYLFQPSFFQQGGVYSKNKITEDLVAEFLNLASVHYRYIDITLNYQNTAELKGGAIISKRNNYILKLNETAFIEVAAREGFKQAFVNADKHNLVYSNSSDYRAAIKLYKDLYGNRMPSVNEADYLNFGEICNICDSNNNLIIRNVYFNDELIALVLLLKDSKRMYNLISCITDNGKKKNANYFLYYHLIKEFSGTNLILDLEGSDIEGVEFFYKRITEINQAYPAIKINNLPFGLKS